MRKIDYAQFFTLRSDGYYQKKINGKTLYDKDPEKLYHKWQAAEAAAKAEKPVPTFKEVAGRWEQAHRDIITTRTWNNYLPHYNDIIAIYGSRPITAVSAQDVNEDLLRAKAKNYSATVIKTRKTIFTQIMNQGVVDGDLAFNPAMSVKLPKNLKKGTRRAPTEEEMKTIVKSIDVPFGFFPFFLLFTGMRKSEALALTRNDINVVQKYIMVNKSLEYVSSAHPTLKPPKTEAGIRTVPIVNTLYRELMIYLSDLEGDILFPSPRSNRNKGGGYMTEKAYEVAWANYCAATGLELTAHQLRHGTATILFEAGVDVYTAQQILGHADVTTTMKVYTELRSRHKQKSIKKFEKEASRYTKGVDKGV